ncbi:LLM class flavin-dependent oxidoreductase [Leucobacter sp.]
MRFDLLHVLANRGEPRPWDVLMNEAREIAEHCDALGYEGLWLGEHHFDAEGADQLPNPLMLHTDLATRTRNIRLGVAAIGLPLWHPVRLAEDVAMLDHFSQGRVDIAVGRGILKGEIVNLNPDADRADEEKSRAIFQEHLDILKQAWTAEKFAHRGERYTIPWPELKWNSRAMDPYTDENGIVTSLPIIPQPAQSDLPLWAVSQQEDGIRLAAHQGLSFITSHPAGEKLRRLNAAYDEECERIGRRPRNAFRVAPASREFYIAETEQEARSVMEGAINARFDLISRVRGLQAWLDVDEDPDDPRFSRMAGYDIMMERDHLFIGTPDQVTERMVHMYEDEGWEHFLFGLSQAPLDGVKRSLTLMAEEVIPEVLRRTGQTRSLWPEEVSAA